MAAPTYASNLTDILLDFSSTTGWTALGGGQAGLTAPETDYFIQGSNCISKGAWASATKGMIYDNGTGVTVASGEAVWMWMTHHTPGSIDPEVGAPGGMQMLIGSSASAYKAWDIRGGDTLLYGADWVCAVVDPTITADDTVGSPGSTLQFFGARATLTGGPSKGSPFGIDAFRHGRDFTITNGDLGNGYATFAGIASWNDNISRRYGQFQLKDGTYTMQGRLLFGTSGTTVDFRDSNRNIVIRRNEKVPAAFNSFTIRNASSRVDWTNVNITALGTVSKGTLIVEDNATVNFTDCNFTDMSTFAFLSNSTVLRCTFRRCAQITHGGADLSFSTVSDSTVATDAGALSYNQTADPDTTTEGMSFTKGSGTTHAISFGTSSPLTMTLRDISFSGYNASDSQNDSTLYFARTSGTVTLNLVGVTGNVSIKTAGCTVNKVINPVSTTITVKDVNTFAVIENARVFVQPSDNSGDLNYQETCSIVQSAGTATVTHTAHGLATNDKVRIEGCNETAYNGIHQITVTGANTYTFTVDSGTGSPATGSPTSTTVLISGLTNASGVISDTRSFTVNQPITGRVREGSSPIPYYKTAPINDTVNKDNGLSLTVFLIPD